MEYDKYELLYGGAYSIKDYYMESGNPRQMRGASVILNDCAEDLKKILKDDGICENHIIASGASLSALIPIGTGDKYVSQAENLYWELSRTVNVAFVSVPFVKFNNDYIQTKKHALAEYDNRRSIKFTSWDYQNWPDQALEYDFAPPGAPQHCVRCKIRDTVYEVPVNGAKLYLCTSCAQREAKNKKVKYEQRKRCGCQFKYSYDISDVHDLADDYGRVALLYADVNNLGGQAYKETFDEDRDFHIAVDKAVKNAVYKAIRHVMGADEIKVGTHIDAKFEIIALGGDDVCLLLPGNTALLAAKMIIDEFKNNEYNLTISVAACIANDTTALTYMEKITTTSLDKKAKKLANCKKSNNQSAVHLSYYEKPSDIFPMASVDFDVFYDLLKKVKADSIAISALRNISNARHELKFNDEFKLFFHYYLSRVAEINKNSQMILKQIYNKYINENINGDEDEDNNLDIDNDVDKDESKNPWLDFITWYTQNL